MHDMLSRRGFARLDMLQPTVAVQANTGDLAIPFEYGLRENKMDAERRGTGDALIAGGKR